MTKINKKTTLDNIFKNSIFKNSTDIFFQNYLDKFIIPNEYYLNIISYNIEGKSFVFKNNEKLLNIKNWKVCLSHFNFKNILTIEATLDGEFNNKNIRFFAKEAMESISVSNYSINKINIEQNENNHSFLMLIEFESIDNKQIDFDFFRFVDLYSLTKKEKFKNISQKIKCFREHKESIDHVEYIKTEKPLFYIYKIIRKYNFNMLHQNNQILDIVDLVRQNNWIVNDEIIDLISINYKN